MLNQNNTTFIKKKIAKRVYILIFLSILTACLFYFSDSLKEVITIKYKENSSLNYKVYLKENDLFPTPFLEKDKKYIASLIDYINVDFNYDFNFSDKVKYLYFYKIEADVNVFEKGNEANNIFHENRVLIDTKTFVDQTQKDFDINETVKIKYNEYNDFVRNFKTQTNIIADSNLKLTLYVTVNGDSDLIDEKINNVSKVSIIIPLTEQMINIKLDYKDIKNNEIVKGDKLETPLSIILLFSGWIGVSLLLVNFIILSLQVYAYKSKENPYIKRRKQLLREYDRVIVEIKNDSMINDAKNKINVNSFEELLDVSDRIEQPILHLDSTKTKKSHFVVRDSDTAYLYVLDANDLEDK